jgi:predicted kinase
MAKAKLILMCGFPGSGKSTLLKEAPGAVVLCPDEFRLALTGQEYLAEAEDFVWATVKLTARVLLERDMTVIIDATHLTIGSRAQWLKLAPSHADVECWWVKTPFEVCCERNRNRSRKVPDSIMQRFMDSFVPPTDAEGFVGVVELPYDPVGGTGDPIT